MKKHANQYNSFSGINERLDELVAYLNTYFYTIEGVVQNHLKRKTFNGYLNSYEVCALLKINSSTLYRWRKARKIKYRRIGHRYFYACDDVLPSV